MLPTRALAVYCRLDSTPIAVFSNCSKLTVLQGKPSETVAQEAMTIVV